MNKKVLLFVSLLIFSVAIWSDRVIAFFKKGKDDKIITQVNAVIDAVKTYEKTQGAYPKSINELMDKNPDVFPDQDFIFQNEATIREGEPYTILMQFDPQGEFFTISALCFKCKPRQIYKFSTKDMGNWDVIEWRK